MNPDLRTYRPPGVRRAVTIATLLALSLGAYAQAGDRQSPVNIDKRDVVDAPGPSITTF
jgi:hypothetical protein